MKQILILFIFFVLIFCLIKYFYSTKEDIDLSSNKIDLIVSLTSTPERINDSKYIKNIVTKELDKDNKTQNLYWHEQLYYKQIDENQNIEQNSNTEIVLKPYEFFIYNLNK